MSPGQLGQYQLAQPKQAHLPVSKQVKDLFAELFEREITLVPSGPVTPGPKVPATVATYVDDQLQVAGVVCCDLPLSARAGAAIGLIPRSLANAAIADGRLTETLAENLYEVLNIASSMFNIDGAAHVRLHTMHPAGAPMPPHVQAHALTLGRREDVALGIGGYGAGRMSIVMTG